MRGEWLSSRKPEHLSTTNAFVSLHNLSRIGKQYHVLYARNIHYAVDFLISGRRKGVRKLRRATQFFQAQATYGCLIEQSAENLINFQTAVEEKAK